MGVAAILVRMTRTKFHFPYPRRLKIKLALIGQAVSEKKMFDIADDDGRRKDAGEWVYFKLTYEYFTQVSY